MEEDVEDGTYITYPLFPFIPSSSSCLLTHKIQCIENKVRSHQESICLQRDSFTHMDIMLAQIL